MKLNNDKDIKFDSVNRITRENRISIDRDNFNQFELLKAYYNMNFITGYVESSITGKGYHISGEFKNRTFKQNLDVRRTLGDCRGRLNLDEDRINAGLEEYYTEILFYEKIRKNIKTGEEKYNIDSLPFWGNGLKWNKRMRKSNGNKIN